MGELPGRLAAIVLAAGRGKRMASSLAKVLHPLGGRPLIRHVVETARAAGASPIVVVVGWQADAVQREFSGEGDDLLFAHQGEQLGTGHAAAVGLARMGGNPDEVFLLCGDVPLLRAETLKSLARRHRAGGAAVSVLSAVPEDPAGYGRILRKSGPEGAVQGIVEEPDAIGAQKTLREINTGTYLFDGQFLAWALPRLEAENRQGEFYLTDAVAMAVENGRKVLAVPVPFLEEALGVNTPEDLARAETLYCKRLGEPPASQEGE